MPTPIVRLPKTHIPGMYSCEQHALHQYSISLWLAVTNQLYESAYIGSSASQHQTASIPLALLEPGNWSLPVSTLTIFLMSMLRSLFLGSPLRWVLAAPGTAVRLMAHLRVLDAALQYAIHIAEVTVLQQLTAVLVMCTQIIPFGSKLHAYRPPPSHHTYCQGALPCRQHRTHIRFAQLG